uniref:Xylanase inhibitor TL-XI n=2 Tax=Triticum aestivum TaxID=4565 RepID=Q0WX49_WHEAT|nr:xylanase inhibitor TL-XI precursor [Triticum aestivum]
MASPARSASASPVLLLLVVLAAGASAAPLTITNRCHFTVWPAVALVLHQGGGGTELHPGASWSLDTPVIGSQYIWGRTGCSFDRAGKGRCQTGDCGGSSLTCGGNPAVPVTMAEVSVLQGNYTYGVTSTLKGFNLPMDLKCSSGDALPCRKAGCDVVQPYAKSCSAAGSRLQIVFCP